ncbi:MAG: ABC transporter permease subunit [Rhizobiales bacterium]|nr:ABC transporter permease subunit [Hyphomicrobiales bacterium]
MTGQEKKAFILLLPVMLVIGTLFVGGLLLGLLRSFNYMPVIGLDDPSLDAYARVFANDEFWTALALSLYISVVSTAIATVLAVASALVLRETFKGKRIVTFLFQLNLTIPHVVGAVAILLLLSQSGFLARLGYFGGLIERPSDFPAMVYDDWYLGVIVQYVWKETPFIGLITLAILQSVGADYEAVAQSLGANRWRRLTQVVLPLIAPGVMRAQIVAFAFTFGAFEVPYLLGKTFPTVLPVLAYQRYTDVDLGLRPEAMAMGIVIAAVSTVLILGYMALSRRLGRT